MVKKVDRDHIVGIDIGTSKVVCIVGEILEDGGVKVVGLGQSPSHGLKRGVVVNIEATVDSIQKAVEDAEDKTGLAIRSVYAGIAGGHIRSFNSHGIVAISDSEVTESDVDRVIEAARAVAIPADQKILHILPQEFTIDQQDGIKEPVGMSGVRLEAKVHIVTGAVSSAQNIEKCIRQCGLDPLDITIEQLASSYSVLNEDEKNLGVAMIDIGGGTTDLAIFTGGAIRHTAAIPIAGDQVTNDIAIGFRTPTRNAEEIKVNFANCLTDKSSPEKLIEVSGVADRPAKQITEAFLAQVVQPRYEELYNLVHQELVRSGFIDLIPAGIVLTGGASQVHYAVDLAERVFQMPVRIGLPQRVQSSDDLMNNPAYATAVGLLQYGLQDSFDGRTFKVKKGSGSSMFAKMKSWLQGNL